MSEWHTFKLKDITTKIGSGSTPTGGSGAYKTEGISLIRSQNVLDYKFTEDGLAFIDDDQAYGLRNVIVEANDVLLNITGDSVARCCGAPINWLPARVNQHVTILRSNPENLDHRFLKYSLLASKEELLILSEIGGTRNALTKGMLEDYEVSLPPLPEQKAIASVLSSLDDKIDLLHRQNKTLEAMAETLFRQLFIEDETLAEVAVSELIEFNPKRSLSKGKNAIYLEMAGLSTQNFNATGYYRREFSSGTKFIQQDTLLARITPCLENGKAGYVTFLSDNEVAWGSTEYIVMRPKAGIHPLMAYILCRNQDFKDYAESCMEGSSGRQRVNVDHLKEFTIGEPSDEVIQHFNDYLESIESKLIYNSKQIQTLENLRDTLLPKLMSGEVRVQYQTEEVA